MAHRATRADPRVHALFESATIAPELIEARRWQSSHGEVVAYEVTVNVTAESLAIATSKHSVMDAALAVLSAAVSHDAGCSLASMRLRWGRVARAAHGYREQPARDLALDDRDELARELHGYFSALGQRAPAWLEAGVSIAFDGETLAIEGVDRSERASAERALAPLARRVVLR
jgi:hypothetical protein